MVPVDVEFSVFVGNNMEFHFLWSMSSLMALFISTIQVGLKTELGEGKKQYCRHGPYHLILPKIYSEDLDKTFHISVLPVSPILSNSMYLLFV